MVRGWIARINAFLQENLTGMSTVQLFRREGRNFEKFDEINRAHRDANIDSIFYYAVFYPAIELVGALAASIIIWFGGLDVMSGTLTLGVLVAFLQYSARFYRPISDMSEKFNVLQSAMASSERIFTLLDTPVAVTSLDPARSFPHAPLRGHIVFDHVWFAYNGEDWVLKDVSFEVRPGQRVGLVGATGSGKTTIINLLLRFYDVQRGRILVDGVDIRELEIATLRQLFALVLQDVHLFSGTVGENIRLGERSIDDDAVQTRGRRRARGPLHRRAAGALRRAGGRARRHVLHGAETAAVVRARAGVRPPGADSRRGDVERRHGNRARHPRGARRADGRPHDARHRAPALDDPGHGPHPGAAQGRPARVRAHTSSCSPCAASTSGCTSCSSRIQRRRARKADSCPCFVLSAWCQVRCQVPGAGCDAERQVPSAPGSAPSTWHEAPH